ncbi:MAG: HAD family acid phosphatase [Woeseia sp.]
MRESMKRAIALGTAALIAAGCATTPSAEPEPYTHPGIWWTQQSAEFEAVASQIYRKAGDDLAAKVNDRSWSALPDQTNAEDLQPAIIFDVDETVVSNADFQLILVPPFSDEKLNAWNAANKASGIPGVAEFAAKARAMGVELFFVTNRPCIKDETTGEACPQKAVSTQDVVEAGIPVTEEFVMLSDEKPGWNREKKNRRDEIAKNYRVIMLIGDDLGDFIPCSRRRAVSPCTTGATAQSRQLATAQHRDYWGNGWYILPNPMHGSWTTVLSQ